MWYLLIIFNANSREGSRLSFAYLTVAYAPSPSNLPITKSEREGEGVGDEVDDEDDDADDDDDEDIMRPGMDDDICILLTLSMVSVVDPAGYACVFLLFVFHDVLRTCFPIRIDNENFTSDFPSAVHA